MTLIEAAVVLALIMVATAITLPQVMATRRAIRVASLPREITSQLRFVRQRAIANRQAVTFHYDNTRKEITIIDHGDPNVSDPTKRGLIGKAVMSGSGYPDTPNSSRVRTVKLAIDNAPATEFEYGTPPGVTPTALGDKATLTSLSGNKINVTFQPDGSVIGSTGSPTDKGLFFYNTTVGKESGMAVSVLGAAGRIKVWRYSTSANKYVE